MTTPERILWTILAAAATFAAIYFFLVDVNDLKAGVGALIAIVFLNWRGQGLK